MIKGNHFLRGLGLLLLLAFATERAAQAYVDPGSGAMFYQILLSGVIGGLFRVRKLTDWIRSRVNSKDSIVNR
jgi:hypothetical protein